MITRITHRSLTQTSLAGLQGNLDRMQQLQQKLSSGKEISRPSDDPSGAIGVMQIRSEMSRAEQYARNADDGLAWLGTADAALQDVNTNLQRARDLTLTAMNGSIGQEGRNAMAVELDNIREQVLTSSNTTYLGRPVFGGTSAATTAYAADGTWTGNDTAVSRNLAPGVSVEVSISGQQAFGPAGDDVAVVLAEIADLMRNNPAGIPAALDRLDTRMAGVREAMSTVGARYNRVETVRAAGEGRAASLDNRLNELEGVDLPATIMELQMQEVAYQSALGATARVLQPSLMDFLR